MIKHSTRCGVCKTVNWTMWSHGLLCCWSERITFRFTRPTRSRRESWKSCARSVRNWRTSTWCCWWEYEMRLYWHKNSKLLIALRLFYLVANFPIAVAIESRRSIEYCSNAVSASRTFKSWKSIVVWCRTTARSAAMTCTTTSICRQQRRKRSSNQSTICSAKSWTRTSRKRIWRRRNNNNNNRYRATLFVVCFFFL